MKILLLSFFLLTVALRLGLRHLNLRHLSRHGKEIPAGFEGEIDPETLQRASAYAFSQGRVALAEALLASLLLVLLLFGGLLPLYDGLVRSMAESPVVQGILFFFGLFLAQYFVGIPFDLYRTFRIEERFGFNATGGRLWLADQAKSLLLSGLLFGLLLSAVFALIAWSPDRWWLWTWAFLSMAALLLIYISPLVIEPLFFRFEELKRPGLEVDIRALAQKAGLSVSCIQQVDASRRSRHSNAYFTGIGRVKRIVLFDTLLEQMEDDEVLAILAHEIGHWKRGHVSKRLLRASLAGLLICWTAFKLLQWGGLPSLLGLEALSLPGQVLLLWFLAGLAGFFITPLMSALSRRDEWQADHDAALLTGNPRVLASALVRLCRENLSNLHPHPLYAFCYYSHPPVVARVRRLLQAVPSPEQGENGTAC